jgi:hypothetical protein
MRKIEREEAPQEMPKKEEKGIKKATKSAPATMSKIDFLETVTSIAIQKESKPKKNGIPTINTKEKISELEAELEADLKKEENPENPVAAGSLVQAEIDYLKRIQNDVDQVVVWKKKEKEARAERETIEAELIDYVMPIQTEDGFNGDYHKSYYVAGITEKITYVSSDRFSAPKDEDIAELNELLGNKFADIIKQNVELKIRDAVFSNKALQKELMELMPKDSDGNVDKAVFAKFFEASTEWEVVEGFDLKRFSLSKKLFDKVMNILRQAKPAIK